MFLNVAKCCVILRDSGREFQAVGPKSEKYLFLTELLTTDKLRTAQRAMERNMLNLKLQDKIPCSVTRRRTKIIEIIEYTLKQK